MIKTKKKLIPFYKEIIGDLDTPVSVFLKINEKNSFLLESVTGGEYLARYSIIGCDPFCVLTADSEKVSVTLENETCQSDTNPITALEDLLNTFSIDSYPELPRFIGGAVGFFSWEIIGKIEKIHFRDKTPSPLPLAHFLFPRILVIFDHVKRKIIIVAWAFPETESQALQRIEMIEKRIRTPLPKLFFNFNSFSGDPFHKTTSNYDKELFQKAVIQVKQSIFEGDVFQLVLSQKFQIESQRHPFEVYRRLRSLNPSPYMFYFDLRDYHIIGTSPEILVRLDHDKAILRPIAGTRPRLENADEDMIQSLLSDEKEKAEHIMLVDLGRNDLGRVCQFGTVKTNSLMEIEKYSHILHMVSNIEGNLAKGKTAFDLFKATFPAGTVSGAPKIRAIELIDELEPEARGLYAGALGYFDFRGNMDLCITIRTILNWNKRYYVQAGAGIVADSDPEREYDETCNKAKGMLLACME